jgi:hypothetical protein
LYKDCAEEISGPRLWLGEKIDFLWKSILPYLPLSKPYTGSPIKVDCEEYKRKVQ